MELKPEVLVVGAGIAGVSLAVSLKARGVSVVLVERDSKARERFKGEYLQPIAVERLEALGLSGVLQDAIERGEATAIRELRFRDLPSGSFLSRALSFFAAGPESSAEPLSDILVRYPDGRHGVSIPQQILATRLRERARTELGENFIEGVDLKLVSKDLERPRFSAGGLKIRPRVVVGADGRNSTVRSWMGGERAPAGGRPVMGAEPEFLVGADFEAEARLSHRYEVIRTAGEGTFSFFRLGEGRQRLYWNTAEFSAGKQGWRSRIESLCRTTVSRCLRQEAELGHLAGAPADTAWMGPAARGCFLLVGDALAVTTPLGGQGMAFALEQVQRLAEGLPLVFRRKAARTGSSSTGRSAAGSVAAALSSQALNRLGRQHHRASRRYFHHINLMNLFLYHLCFSRSRVARHLSRPVFAHWNAHPEVKAVVAEYFAGTRVRGLTPIRIAELLGLPGLPALRALVRAS